MSHQTPSHTSSADASSILVVEPEILVRMVVAEYLRGCGYRVIEAATADEAMVILNSDIKVDVMLAELHGLGATDGFELAKHVREVHAHIDVILTSGVSSTAAKAGDLCEDTVLKKPYHPDEVMRRIQLLRERRRASKVP